MINLEPRQIKISLKSLEADNINKIQELIAMYLHVELKKMFQKEKVYFYFFIKGKEGRFRYEYNEMINLEFIYEDLIYILGSTIHHCYFKDVLLSSNLEDCLEIAKKYLKFIKTLEEIRRVEENQSLVKVFKDSFIVEIIERILRKKEVW